MSFTDWEKAAEKALKRLYPFLIKKLNPDVRNELYARDMLTWQEQQLIGECLGDPTQAQGHCSTGDLLKAPLGTAIDKGMRTLAVWHTQSSVEDAIMCNLQEG